MVVEAVCTEFLSKIPCYIGKIQGILRTLVTNNGLHPPLPLKKHHFPPLWNREFNARHQGTPYCLRYAFGATPAPRQNAAHEGLQEFHRVQLSYQRFCADALY